MIEYFALNPPTRKKRKRKVSRKQRAAAMRNLAKAQRANRRKRRGNPRKAAATKRSDSGFSLERLKKAAAGMKKPGRLARLKKAAAGMKKASIEKTSVKRRRKTLRKLKAKVMRHYAAMAGTRKRKPKKGKKSVAKKRTAKQTAASRRNIKKARAARRGRKSRGKARGKRRGKGSNATSRRRTRRHRASLRVKRALVKLGVARRNRRGQFVVNPRRRRRNSNPGRKMLGALNLGTLRSEATKLLRLETWTGVAQGVAGFSIALSLPIAVARLAKKPQLNQGPIGVAASAVASVVGSQVAGMISARAKQNVLAGGLVATGIKLIAWAAPKVARRLIPMDSAPSVSMAPAPPALPAAAAAGGTSGFGDSGIMSAEELIAGEANGGVSGFLEMGGVGDFMDPDALASVTSDVGPFDAGKERF